MAQEKPPMDDTGGLHAMAREAGVELRVNELTEQKGLRTYYILIDRKPVECGDDTYIRGYLRGRLTLAATLDAARARAEEAEKRAREVSAGHAGCVSARIAAEKDAARLAAALTRTLPRIHSCNSMPAGCTCGGMDIQIDAVAALAGHETAKKAP